MRSAAVGSIGSSRAAASTRCSALGISRLEYCLSVPPLTSITVTMSPDRKCAPRMGDVEKADAAEKRGLCASPPPPLELSASRASR